MKFFANVEPLVNQVAISSQRLSITATVVAILSASSFKRRVYLKIAVPHN